mmetsp:Transcript_5053/g.14915  ORF Transcript_5053/g.14915 Transcript_5053/m.14915 type:complete len:245 (-) Transcript_5053:329-1063(-)
MFRKSPPARSMSILAPVSSSTRRTNSPDFPKRPGTCEAGTLQLIQYAKSAVPGGKARMSASNWSRASPVCLSKGGGPSLFPKAIGGGAPRGARPSARLGPPPPSMPAAESKSQPWAAASPKFTQWRYNGYSGELVSCWTISPTRSKQDMIAPGTPITRTSLCPMTVSFSMNTFVLVSRLMLWTLVPPVPMSKPAIWRVKQNRRMYSPGSLPNTVSCSRMGLPLSLSPSSTSLAKTLSKALKMQG